MINFLKYKGYLGTIEYSEEDKLLCGEIAGIKDLVLYHGNDINDLEKSFKEAIDDYLIMCEENNLEPNVTSIEELKKTINEEAQKTINNLIAM